MSTTFEIIAMVMLGIGVALALIHVLLVTVQLVRRAPAGSYPDLIPVGYMGVGLVLAFAGFYLGRGVSSGAWGAIQDAAGIVMVLTIAAGGYGAAHEWIELRAKTNTAWYVPIGIAAVSGIALGAGASSIW